MTNTLSITCCNRRCRRVCGRMRRCQPSRRHTRPANQQTYSHMHARTHALAHTSHAAPRRTALRCAAKQAGRICVRPTVAKVGYWFGIPAMSTIRRRHRHVHCRHACLCTCLSKCACLRTCLCTCPCAHLYAASHCCGCSFLSRTPKHASWMDYALPQPHAPHAEV